MNTKRRELITGLKRLRSSAEFGSPITDTALYEGCQTSPGEIAALFGSISQWHRAAKVVYPNTSRRNRYSFEELRKALQRAAEEYPNGLTISGYRDWRKRHPNNPDVPTIKRMTNNSPWNDILTACGIQPARPRSLDASSDEEIIKTIRDVTQGMYMSTRRYDLMRTSTDLSSCAIREKYGSWLTAVEIAGIQIPSNLPGLPVKPR